MFSQPGNPTVSSYLSRFQWAGKPQRSKLRQQGTVIELLLYFRIWPPAPAGTRSMVTYDAAPEAEGKWPKKHICLESPSLFQTSAVLTGGCGTGVGAGEGGWWPRAQGRGQNVEVVGITGWRVGCWSTGQPRPRP